jgi:multidrug transporter EmrE-like cation transporter
MNILYWTIIASIVAIIPLFLIKQYLVYKHVYYLYLSLLTYVILIYTYLKIFDKSELSSMYIILQITQILLVITGGILLFKESLTFNKVIGIIAGIISIIFLNK